jgi:uncharacterized protein (TIGR02466 family)
MTQACKSAPQPQLNVAAYFPSLIYTVDRTDFLATVNQVSERFLAQKRSSETIDAAYPVLMTDNYFDAPELSSFLEFIGSSAWSILAEQGYAMQDKAIVFTDMWTQEHHKHSIMEQHAHGNGAQIIGFYFLEVPDTDARLAFHDPRIGKLFVDLPETDQDQVTVASKAVNFVPKPGLMVFANAWLAHSLTKHVSEQPLKFVHFNLTVQAAPQVACAAPSAEVV